MAGLLAWAADVVRSGGGGTSDEDESDSIPLIFNPEQEKYIRDLNLKAASLTRSVQDLRQRIPPPDISQRLPDLHAHSLASNAALALQLNAHSSTKEQAQLRELTLLEENAAFEKAISECNHKIQEKLQEAEQLRAKLEELDATTTELQIEESASDTKSADSTDYSSQAEAHTPAHISSLQESLDNKKKNWFVTASIEDIVQNLERQWSTIQEQSLKQPSPAQREKLLDKQLQSLMEQLAAKQAQAEGLISEIHLKEMELDRLNGIQRKVESSTAYASTARNRFSRSNSDYIVDPHYKPTSKPAEAVQRQMLFRSAFVLYILVLHILVFIKISL